MGVYVKGNPKEGEYKLIKTTDGFVLEGKDIAYACIEIDLVRCEECKHKMQALSTEKNAIGCELISGTFYEDFFCKCGER